MEVGGVCISVEFGRMGSEENIWYILVILMNGQWMFILIFFLCIGVYNTIGEGVEIDWKGFFSLSVKWYVSSIDDKVFIEQLDKHKKKITFYEVGAHYQNCVAEIVVKNILSEQGLSVTHNDISTHNYLKHVMTAYDLLFSVKFHKLWKIGNDRLISMIRLPRLKNFPDLKMKYICRYPIYVLDTRLQWSSAGRKVEIQELSW